MTAQMKTAQNGDVDLLRLRSTCLFNMGDLDSAIKHLHQAMRADPDNVVVRTQYRAFRDIDEKKKVGDEAFRQGKNEEAISSWSQCIDLANQSPVFLSKLHLNRGIALTKLKKHEEAIKDYTKAIYYNTEYVKAYLKRSESYLAQGGPEKIQKCIE
jgi:DnaJ homolog subfamily C member 7